MTTEQFNELLERFTGGLPVTIVVSRLTLALRAMIEDGGESAEQEFRRMVAAVDEE